jgi:hypothetical protein
VETIKQDIIDLKYILNIEILDYYKHEKYRPECYMDLQNNF